MKCPMGKKTLNWKQKSLNKSHNSNLIYIIIASKLADETAFACDTLRNVSTTIIFKFALTKDLLMSSLLTWLVQMPKFVESNNLRRVFN